MSNKNVQNTRNLFRKVLILGYWIQSYQYGHMNNKTFPTLINHIKPSVKICLRWVGDTLKFLKHQETRINFSVLSLWFIEWIMHLCQTDDHPFQTLPAMTYFSPSTRSTLSLFHFPPPHHNHPSSKRNGAINCDRHDMQSLE